MHLLSISRSSPSGVLGQADTMANLGLTTARATTCQSNQQSTSTSRVSTRSSSTILRDGREDYLRKMTPVNKIRGLVESLNQRQRKVAPAIQSSSPSSSSKGPMQNRKQLLPRHHQGDVTNSFKRKREEKTFQSQESFCKPPKANDKEDATASDSLSPKKSKCLKQMEFVKFSRPSLSIPLTHQSQIFPILKLKRTSEYDNSYVAVTAFSPQDSKLKEVCGTEIPAEVAEPIIPDETAAKQLNDTQDTMHRHNTRFKARKDSEISLDKTDQPASILEEDCGPGKSMLMPSEIRIKSELKGNNHSKCNTVISQRSSAPVKVQKKVINDHHSDNIKVGDIVWGKVHGHPWWPGRVLGIPCEASETNEGCQIVKVSWYASPTMSDISSNSLLMFQENFKRLFKKQKKGAYKLAVRQAWRDLEVYMNGTQVMPA